MEYTQQQLRDLTEGFSNGTAAEFMYAPPLIAQLLSALVRIEELEAKVAEGKALLTEALAEITSQEFAGRIKAASEFGQAITKN